jgi:hypothetical protein
MGPETKPSQGSIDIAKHGIMFQFNTMFDEPTRKAMLDLGMQKFLDHMIATKASDLATIMFYASFLHPNAKDS